jgi:preprotein translocase subunit YajC
MSSFAILVLLAFTGFVVTYVVMSLVNFYRIRRKRMEIHKKIKIGNTVLTSCGLYGKVVNVEGDQIVLEVDNGVNIKFLKDAIVSIINE